ncbi:hypothetical protein ABE425_03810 [Chryseobacterium cucumeris]|uniref:Lipoprotein n=1 Tax=Chryseobacterium candidae TaxID=1978493 RepID=A0ABY2R4J9_9FLAO|nr:MULTISPECIES: hypothetical protein [Chryseobacterium]RKE82736.1 hypothetical protein DEU39_2298 [Chryseobacterium sp. AG363]THV57673.1 hypothetical protein EK417_14720 [Chryseobacterium candidae]TXI96828.1 MAG: hypothetical protein E6Q35_07130 [Chryseobacterium cucumeris]WFB69588.1 hypothetical protein PZ898_09170 [Chryseobacterium sp. WX]WNI38562.1 hypothetical protein RHP76_08715 [Chryseobacterium sp. SG20098]
MKNLILLFSFLAIVSCNGQTDLESLKFDEKVSDNITKGEKETEANYGLLSYKQADVKNYKLGTVSFSEYTVPKGYDYSNNNLALFVNSYQNNQYLGFILNLAKEDEGKKLIDYLTKTYGNPEKRSTDKTGAAYFWDASAKNKWIFLTQTQELTQDNTKYTNTKLIVVKKGTRVENSSDAGTFSILDSFTLAYPKK